MCVCVCVCVCVRVCVCVCVCMCVCVVLEKLKETEYMCKRQRKNELCKLECSNFYQPFFSQKFTVNGK
jgi:hypothetical protein